MKKKLSLNFQFFKHRWPIFAIGFMGRHSEFLVVLWLVDIRLAWGY